MQKKKGLVSLINCHKMTLVNIGEFALHDIACTVLFVYNLVKSILFTVYSKGGSSLQNIKLQYNA